MRQDKRLTLVLTESKGQVRSPKQTARFTEKFSAIMVSTILRKLLTGGSYVPDAGLNPAAHFGTFERKLPQALELDPLFVNCLAGKRSLVVP